MNNFITLVVGGGGFIGSALIHNLLANDKNRKIRVLGRSKKPANQLPENIEYMIGDASNSEDILAALEGVNKVVDLAYSTVPKTSFDDPVFDVTSNLSSVVNLMQKCSGLKLDKFLLVSSGGAVYGHSRTLTVSESHPTNPISPYGISKLLSEKYAVFFQQMHGLPIVIARPSNPYGINQLSRLNQGFIGAAIAATYNNKSIEIYGARGKIRDYIYISDLAEGLRRCLDDGIVGETYNLGTGRGYDNIEIVDCVRSILSRRKYEDIIFKQARPFDVNRNILDSTKAEIELGWKCDFEIQQGIQEICNR
jgi:UDP-glucose 4-epimerase